MMFYYICIWFISRCHNLNRQTRATYRKYSLRLLLFLVKRKKRNYYTQDNQNLKTYFLGAEWHNFSDFFSPFLKKKHHKMMTTVRLNRKEKNNLDLLAVFEREKKLLFFAKRIWKQICTYILILRRRRR